MWAPKALTWQRRGDQIQMHPFEGWMLSKQNLNELALYCKVCLPVSSLLMHKYLNIQYNEYFIFKDETKQITNAESVYGWEQYTTQ